MIFIFKILKQINFIENIGRLGAFLRKINFGFLLA